MRDSFIKRLIKLALDDSRIVLITGDLGFKVFDEYRERLQGQFINAGIAEQNITALATGMAMSGKIVFTYSIGNFSTLRCLEQIRNDSCYHETNVKIVSVGGGFSYGPLGISHHATEDLSIMRSLPNITVVSPCTLWEAAEATEAIVKHQGTCYLRLDKSYGTEVSNDKRCFELGKARTVRDGKDCIIIVTGGILEEVQQTAERLEKDGISAGIISVHTLVPFDKETIRQAAINARNIVTVEENTIRGGLGSAVAESLLDDGVAPDRFLRIGLDSGFSSIVGDQQYLRRQYRMGSEQIYERIVQLLAS